MEKPGKFIIANDCLQIEPACVLVGSGEWFSWLSQHSQFLFHGKNGHFSAQSELRCSRPYWYAYRRRAGKLFKLYLGKSEELTLDRLEQISIALAGKNSLEQFSTRSASEQPSSIESRIDTSFLPMAKVNMPVPPLHLFTRPRLTGQINTPLTLIYAPSGFGKSTLLNDWKRTCGHPVAWISLDESDNQSAHFWYSVIMALQVVQPDFGNELLSNLRTASPFQLSEIVTRLTDAAASLPHFGLVLDDFQRIHQAEIYTSIQVWLAYFPKTMQLVIVGHTKPPLSLGRLRARDFLTELDANDLRFSLEEGIHYLQQVHPEPPLAYTDLEKLVKHTEGWAAGLTLIAQALGKTEDRREFIDTFSGAHVYLREYFLETVLQRSSPAAQEFLLKTAILKHLTGDLCDAVTAQTGGAQMLLRLWQADLFIVRLEEQGAYRYHDLFSEMLLSQLQARFPDEIPLLHQRAAQWYRQQNTPADAVYHLLVIEAWEEAAALMETMALRELEQYGEDSRLLRWLQELPENVVQKHKTLLFVYLRLAEVALPGQKIERFIGHIETNLARIADHQPTQAEQEVLLEIQSLRQNWQQGAALPLAARDAGENSAKWELLNGLHLIKQGYGPTPELFEIQVTNLLHRAQTQKNLFVVLMAGGELARCVFSNGKLRRSEKIAWLVLEYVITQRGKLPEPASILLTLLSQIYLERNELELAGKYLDQALEVDPNPTSSNMLVRIGIQRTFILVAQGKTDDALANMCAIRALHIRRPSARWTDHELMVYHAYVCVRQGDLASAELLLRESQGSSEQYLFQLVQAEILLEKKQAAAAEKILSGLVVQVPGGGYFEPLTRARVLLACSYFEQHKINQALQLVTEVVRQSAPERFFRPFLESAARCKSLLLLTLKIGKLTSEAQSFIKQLLRLSGYGAADILISGAEIDALSIAASISQREQELLQLLSNGYSNQEMAQKLYISESTVKTHLGNIYNKLGVNSRTKAVKSARELKLT
ncbi:MAG: LuxR C-terminal-related transcriptional regulator [Chloroflexota bacterium]